MEFLNRNQELDRINRVFDRQESVLLVVYGRRRMGKTRLLQQLSQKDLIFFVADQRETPIQIGMFARHIASLIPGFDSVVYPDWESILMTMNDRLNRKTIIILDEFPYLVKNAPELPSIIQRMFDNRSRINFHLILSGSSQQMMHKIVIDSNSPLYGRAHEIIKINPLNIYWLKKALNCTGIEAVEEYAVWGGVPRYWEIRDQETCLRNAIIKHVMDSNGILYEEPQRLFLDDSRETIQMSTLVTLIASGVHRLSEIASRTGKPATNLTRPLQKLINLGYIQREIPFGSSTRNAKRSLYKLADPFMFFYFRFVAPDKPSLELGLAERIYNDVVLPSFPGYCSSIWESICRNAIPLLYQDKLFLPGSRWWQGTRQGKESEIDIVSSSRDKSELVVSEVKWSGSINLASICSGLEKKIARLPGISGKKIRKVLFLKNRPDYVPKGFSVFTPEEVIEAFKPGG